MPLFLSDEEFQWCSHDASLVAEKADAFIRDLHRQLETVKAQADASAITAEQTCALLEQKYITLSAEFGKLESQNAQLNAVLEQRLTELAEVQAEKHQLHLKAIAKDGEIERLSTEVSELHKSKRQLLELLEQKDIEIGEKNATIQSYLDKIVNMTGNASQKEARLRDSEAELARCRAACDRLSQEKELIEKHNAWLNEELTAKTGDLLKFRKTHAELEADTSAKLDDVERQLNESSSSLKWNKERVRELELKLASVQEEFCSCKDAAATNEERFSAEIATVTKLVELYKESSEEWSRKAGELEGVIKALEMHLSQVENDYKEKLEKEVSVKTEIEKEAGVLKEKLEKCEAEMENNRKANELSILPIGSFTKEIWVRGTEPDDSSEDSRMLVPKVPVGISGTALAASLLRDGWSLAKMYEKYQEAVDAVRHERLGRKQSQAILERVLFEIEEKAALILDERAEHERMVEAYSVMNERLQESLAEQAQLEGSIRELKAELKRHERDHSLAQKEIVDLQKQVTILLKECRDIQLRCGSGSDIYADDSLLPLEMHDESDAERVISERLLTFKDINGLVEQNVQLRSLVRSLSDQNEKINAELREKFELELQRHGEEAATKVLTVLKRAEEQGRMIESLHSSVAMYKRLYEEELKRHASYPHSTEAVSEDGRKDLMLLHEVSQEATNKAHEQATERVKSLEEELAKSRSSATSLRLERDKLAMEANFARERLDSYMKEFEHQRGENNGIQARNVEFSQLVVNYQRRLRESAEALHDAEETSRKLTMEVSILKHEKEVLLNSEKRALDEVRNVMERVHRLQTSLDTIQSVEEVREEVRALERAKQEEYTKQLEREWAEAKKELQEERDNVRTLTFDRENTLKNAMKQVEVMSKELADALRAAATAEAKAAVAEARCSDLEVKIKSSKNKVAEVDGGYGASSNEMMMDLHKAKEEVEKLKEEAQANKDHMLQYKNIAQVNEAALKQMESAHEKFKDESDRLKKSLEAELLLLRERVSELESDSISKSKDAASVVAVKEVALDSALSEISSVKEAISVKQSQITGMEIQMSSLKEDLEKALQRWHTTQKNYERQVILQSETIQELTMTSQSLASLQEEASELRKLADAQKSENDILKTKWESEKSVLEQSKNEAERKFTEINEQNKILHDRLEALHIKLAEKDRSSAGISSGSASPYTQGDGDLQNVISYLRRSKEIAETEISLLKQEKLRLQSQLDSALKASERAQSLLHTERASSRTMFTEAEFKSLQLQVREMNLLRESNMQLREENKHNFEECQKLREEAQKAIVEIDHIKTLLSEKQVELDACHKEIEMQKIEKEQLEKRVSEVLEKCKNIDVQDYDRMKEAFHQIQVKLQEKEAEFEETKRLVSEKQDIITRLEQELTNIRSDLTEKEKRIVDIESSFKLELDKQKKASTFYKKRIDSMNREKDELNKEKHALSRQLEESRQGKRPVVDATIEKAMKEKEKEKDTRIQMLEKTLEREREDLRKEREDNKKEKAKRQKTENAIYDLLQNINQEKKKLLDEFEKNKHARGHLAESTEASGAPLPSESALDEQMAAYLTAVEHVEAAVNSNFGDALAARNLPAETSSLVDKSSTVTSGRLISALAPATKPSLGGTASSSRAKPTDERDKGTSLLKPSVETRKTGRRLVRPRLGRPQEPTVDVEISEMEGPSNSEETKPGPAHETETQGDPALPTQPATRKRLASSSASELHEDSLIQQETGSDVQAQVLKKSRGSDSPQEGAEGQLSVPAENVQMTTAVEESFDAAGPHTTNEEAIDTEKDVEADETKEHSEEPKEPPLDIANQLEAQIDSNIVAEEILDKIGETDEVFNDGQPKDGEGHDPQHSMMEVESEKEEGELVPDVEQPSVEGDTMVMVNSPEPPEPGEGPETAVPITPIVGIEEEAIVSTGIDAVETTSIEVLNDEKIEGGYVDQMEETAEGSDKSSNDQASDKSTNDQGSDKPNNDHEISEMEQSSKGASGAVESSLPSVPTDAATKHSAADVSEPDEAKVDSKSTTINLTERARERAVVRQLGMVSPSPPSRGRGRSAMVLRNRGSRGGRSGRGGRGQGSGEQE
ncbi:nuclear-pore anchor isoform X2 [Telopea speciosissima]|uniref:nuclear-pore anchor isoform X2 n=1 Tax=Telopea speciosissima TaxID=54955 RepID=UPI001CC70A70|nr:nuclear-pore anchor isoform X2 [Telopea speciosissima]